MFEKYKQAIEEKVTTPVQRASVVAIAAIVVAVIAFIVAVTSAHR